MKIKDKNYYLTILEALAKKSTCDRAAISAIILKDNIIVSTGNNGAPRKIKHWTKNHVMYNNH